MTSRSPQPGDDDRDYAKWVANGQHVEARWATGDGVRATGRVVAWSMEPTLTILTEDDERVHWVASLVHPVEPVDDPSKDLTGSIRRTKTLTCIARERDGGADFHRWIAVELNEAFTDQHMRGSPVIGAVPGTPAAEAQADPTLTLPDVIERNRTQVLPCGHDFAEHGGMACTDPVDGQRARVARAAGLLASTAAPAPRVFRSDGPEPPLDVLQVRDRDGALLIRVDNEDLWIGEGQWDRGRNTYPASPKPWCDHTMPKYDPYTEVLP